MMATTKLKMATYNARGAQTRGAFARLVWHLEAYGKKHGISVWLIQEHNLNPAGRVDHLAIARARKFDMVIGYAECGENGVHWGGTLILATERVVTLTAVHETSAVTVADVMWAPTVATKRVACVYAPVRPLLRTDFLKDELSKYLDKRTYAAGNWNCVPDVTLDVQGPNALAYANVGAMLLEEVVEEKELFDIRREQLGRKAEPTRVADT